MTARLYSNENFPLPAVEALRQLGHDVLTTRDVGYGQPSPSCASGTTVVFFCMGVAAVVEVENPEGVVVRWRRASGH
jgi:hypothetical protein